MDLIIRDDMTIFNVDLEELFTDKIDTDLEKIDIDQMYNTLLMDCTIDRGEFNHLIELVYYYSLIKNVDLSLCQSFYLQTTDDDLKWSQLRYLYILYKVKQTINKRKSFSTMYS